MKLIEARHFVFKNARYIKDAPENSKYFVRFPFPYSTMVFFSGDTLDLVNRVYNFGRTKKGKELWSKVPAGEYLVDTSEPDESGEDQ